MFADDESVDYGEDDAQQLSQTSPISESSQLTPPPPSPSPPPREKTNDAKRDENKAVVDDIETDRRQNNDQKQPDFETSNKPAKQPKSLSPSPLLTAQQDSEADQVTNDQVAATVVKVGSDENDSEKPLPSGWKAVESRTSGGDTYYYNTFTRESTWDRPTQTAEPTNDKANKTRQPLSERAKASRKKKKAERRRQRQIQQQLEKQPLAAAAAGSDTNLSQSKPIPSPPTENQSNHTDSATGLSIKGSATTAKQVNLNPDKPGRGGRQGKRGSPEPVRPWEDGLEANGPEDGKIPSATGTDSVDSVHGTAKNKRKRDKEGGATSSKAEVEPHLRRGDSYRPAPRADDDYPRGNRNVDDDRQLQRNSRNADDDRQLQRNNRNGRVGGDSYRPGGFDSSAPRRREREESKSTGDSYHRFAETNRTTPAAASTQVASSLPPVMPAESATAPPNGKEASLLSRLSTKSQRPPNPDRDREPRKRSRSPSSRPAGNPQTKLQRSSSPAPPSRSRSIERMRDRDRVRNPSKKESFPPPEDRSNHRNYLFEKPHLQRESIQDDRSSKNTATHSDSLKNSSNQTGSLDSRHSRNTNGKPSQLSISNPAAINPSKPMRVWGGISKAPPPQSSSLNGLTLEQREERIRQRERELGLM